WEKDVQNELSRETIKLTVNDGTFNGAIYSQNNQRFVNRGTYSDPSALAYLAEGADVNIKLAADYNGPGFGLFSAGNGNDAVLDIDLGGYTWKLNDEPLFGSTGTVSQYFHLEKGTNDNTAVTFKNGTITVPDDIAGKMLIQNYCKLTLDNVTLTGNANCGYIVSNNNGSCDIKNSTITAAEDKCAFDVYSFSSYDGVKVTVDNSTINGRVEFGGNNEKSNIFLTVNSGTLNGNLVVESAYATCASTNITIAKGVSYGSYTGWETYLE
ncbi:MAG: cell surface protein, partial [Candidatus Cryptobacteroides sp.]